MPRSGSPHRHRHAGANLLDHKSTELSAREGRLLHAHTTSSLAFPLAVPFHSSNTCIGSSACSSASTTTKQHGSSTARRGAQHLRLRATRASLCTQSYAAADHAQLLRELFRCCFLLVVFFVALWCSVVTLRKTRGEYTAH